jgi:hypothetical protein
MEVASFQTVLAEYHDFEPFTMHRMFKAERVCRICQLKVRTTKHLKTHSHRRKEICVQLFVLQREMKAVPSSECLAKLRDLLQIKTTEDCYLLSLCGGNWPVITNTGVDDQRGKLRDDARDWFIDFLSDLEKTCRSVQGTEMSAIAEDIRETISDLRLKKRRDDPLAQVLLCMQYTPSAFVQTILYMQHDLDKFAHQNLNCPS